MSRPIKGRRTWIAEEITRAAFEENLGHTFVKTRNLRWNGWRELDGYCEELGIAFQYHGKQHYEWIPFFHRTESAFHLQQQRDLFTETCCEANWVVLFTIPYTIKLQNVRSYVRELLAPIFCENLIAEKKLARDAEFLKRVKGDLEERDRLLGEIKKIAAEHGGICRAEVYVDAITPLDFSCEKGHEFIRAPKIIKEVHRLGQSFCLQCNETFAKGTEKIRTDVERFGFKLIDCWMIKGQTRDYRQVQVVCPHDHEPFAVPANYFQGDKIGPRGSCPTCKTSKAEEPRKRTMWTDEDLEQATESCGFEFKSKYVEKSVSYLDLVCPIGHEITLRQSNFMPVTNGRPRQGCPECKKKKLGMRQTLSEEIIKARLAEWQVVLTGKYIVGTERKTTAVEFRCLVCNSEFKATWNNISRRVKKCPSCV